MLDDSARYLQPQPENLPAELTALPCWCNWHAPSKRPDPPVGHALLEFAEALARNALHLGFHIRREDGFLFVDIDDPSTEEAKKVLAAARKAGAYIERSVSGRGWHIIGRATLARNIGAGRIPGVELYSDRRYATMTGVEASGSPEADIQNIANSAARRTERPATASNGSMWNPNEHAQLLEHISPDCGYEEWVTVGMALLHSGAEFDVWDRWSSQGESYPGTLALRDKWMSFADYDGETVGIGTLHHLAGIEPGEHYDEREWGDALERLDSMLMSNAIADSFDDQEFAYPGLIVQGHAVVIAAMSGAGKTALVTRFLAGEMTRRGFDVRYISTDASPSDVKDIQRIAHAEGWKFYAPDFVPDGSMQRVLQALRQAAAEQADLSRKVFVLDTLKKCAQMLDKRQQSSFFTLLRKLCALGATVIALSHCNKYRDKDENLIFEGVGDVRSDCDELIFLEMTNAPFDAKIISTLVTLEANPYVKLRAKLEPMTFTMDEHRTITRDEDYTDVVEANAAARQWRKDEDDVLALRQLIEEAKRALTQEELVEMAKFRSISRPRVMKLLKVYAGQHWQRTREGKNNAYRITEVQAPP